MLRCALHFGRSTPEGSVGIPTGPLRLATSLLRRCSKFLLRERHTGCRGSIVPRGTDADNAPIRSRWTVSRCMGRRDARVTTVQGKGPCGRRTTEPSRGTCARDLGARKVRPHLALVAHVRTITLLRLNNAIRDYDAIHHLVCYPWQLLLTAVLSGAHP